MTYSTLTLVSSGATDAVLSGDEQRVFVAMANGDVEVFDLATHAVLTTWHIGSSLGAMSISPDGSFLLAVEHNAGLGLSTVYRVNTADGAVQTFSTTGSAFGDVQIVDAHTAIFTGGANQIRQLDLSTGTFSNMTGGISYSNSGTLTDSGRYTLLAEPGISDGPLFIYDSHAHSFTASGDDYQSPYTGFNWGSQAVSEQAGLVLQFIYYGSINVYNLDLKYLGSVQVGEPIDGLTFDATGQYVYVHLVSGSVVKYSANPWTPIESYAVAPMSWDNYNGYGNQLLVSQSGEHIVVMNYDGSGNGIVQLIDLPASNNLVPGTGEADVLVGGGGDDSYVINNSGDTIVEWANGGTDTVNASVSFALPANVENLTLTGSAAINGTGNELANIVTGNAGANLLSAGAGDDTLAGGDGNDTLEGGAGNDTLDGGPGTDTATFEHALAAVTVDLSAATDHAHSTGAGDPAGIGIDQLVSIENIIGSAFDDTLTGNASDNTLIGGAGNDTLSGGDGNDTLVGNQGYDLLEGGAGDDVYIVDDGIIQQDTVIEGANAGIDQVNASTYFFLPENVENLTLTGTYAVDGWGNGLDNVMNGNSAGNQLSGFGGNDILSGGDGNDILDGGEGNDTIYGGDGSDLIKGGGGDDLIYAGTGGNGGPGNSIYDGAGNDIVYGGTDTDMFGGSEGNDYYDGAGGADYVYYNHTEVLAGITVDMRLATGQVQSAGQGDAANIGIDTLVSIESITGTGHDDTMIAGNAAISFYGNDGNDALSGGSGDNVLDGGDGNDTLIGGAGNDTLTGSSGVDTLTGGPGNDTFSDGAAGLNGDTITDFSAGDKIVITDAALAGFTFSLSGSTLTYSGGSLTLSNIPAGSFVASAAAGGGVELDFVPFHQPMVVHAGDFNGDHRDDILWRSDSGQFADWLANSSGGFGDNWANSFADVPVNWKIGGIGDFNGDGRDDVLWRDASSGVMTDWLGTTTGGFSDNYGNASASVPLNWTIAAIGDFNGDHRDDILWRSESGQITDWLGTASGGFSDNFSNASANVGNNWTVVATGDFDGDGKDDLLWRSDAGAIVDWLGAANGGFTVNYGNSFASVSTSWTIVGTGDFNGDHRDDILWRSDAGVVTDWLGQADGGFSSNWANVAANVPTDWKIASIGDFNGDGKDDILWRNDNGQTTDWLGTANGGFTDNYSDAATFVSTNWHVQAEAFL